MRMLKFQWTHSCWINWSRWCLQDQLLQRVIYSKHSEGSYLSTLQASVCFSIQGERVIWCSDRHQLDNLPSIHWPCWIYRICPTIHWQDTACQSACQRDHLITDSLRRRIQSATSIGAPEVFFQLKNLTTSESEENLLRFVCLFGGAQKSLCHVSLIINSYLLSSQN